MTGERAVDRDDTAMLEAGFASLRAQAPEPSEALVARVLRDAAAVQAGQRAQPAKRQAYRRPMLAALRAWLSAGMPAAGMATAALFGLWIGFAQPGGMSSLTALGLLPATEEITLFPDETVLLALADLGAAEALE
jgi:ferric-dicitrate binding protein FerR (iron transport regulator)